MIRKKEILESICGAKFVTDNPELLKTYGKDWTLEYKPNPSFVVFPTSADVVSKIMVAAKENKWALVPSGGRTGLAGGASACDGEIVLSLEKMNKIIDIDTIGMTATVEPGVTTEALQQAAENAGLFFGLDLAAKGSCQIGGNIATNAGGTKFIKFGGMREQVLGLEVVLTDGTILDMCYSTRKNNTGYDLKQIFIGSEGTLGVITKAIVKLLPPLQEKFVALLAIETLENLASLMVAINRSGLSLSAFEFFTQEALDLVIQFHSFRQPVEGRHAAYLLLEWEGQTQLERFESFFEKNLESGLVSDGMMATQSNEFKEIWAYRENITESISQRGWVRKNDVSLALGDLPQFLLKLHGPLSKKAETLGINLILFGHVGDGNIHINYSALKTKIDYETFLKSAKTIESQIFDEIEKHRGSISAEHGIGLLKKKELGRSRTSQEIEIMKKWKGLLDPTNILNPGKIF